MYLSISCYTYRLKTCFLLNCSRHFWGIGIDYDTITVCKLLFVVIEQRSLNIECRAAVHSKYCKTMDSMEYEVSTGSNSPPSISPQLQGQTAGTMPPTLYPMLPPMGLPPTASERPYNQLVNFEIEKKIGRGQFSTVFRARCKKNGTIVALKKVQVINYRCVLWRCLRNSYDCFLEIRVTGMV